MNITYNKNKYYISIDGYSFKLFDTDDMDTPLASGEFNDKNIFDIRIDDISLVDKTLLGMIKDRLTKYYIDINKNVVGATEWTDKDPDERKDEVNIDLKSELFNLQDTLNNLDDNDDRLLDTVSNAYFDYLIESIKDDDVKREVAFIKNKMLILVKKIYD